MSNDWWKFDGLGFDEDTLDAQIEPHEKTALDAIRAIADFGEANPDQALIVMATLRKLSTVAQSNAQTLSLRSMAVKRGVK